MTPFFSIIIPVYNVAPYLRECLDSVLAQTFTNWEAICVDDGSTDGSGAILDEYAVKDKRFRVIHQNNAGVSAARNAAMELMNGDWFLFVDADDEIRQDALQIFSKYLSNRKIDGILIYPYTSSWDGGKIPIRKVETKVLVEDASKEDLFLGPYAANGFVFSRIYRRSKFSDLRFMVGMSMCEDVCFWFDALSLNAKWMIINAEYYLYRQRPDSACGVEDPHKCVQALHAVLHAIHDIEQMSDVSNSAKLRYLQRFPYTVVHNLNLAIANFKRLSFSELDKLQNECDGIVQAVGCWPHGALLRIKLRMTTSSSCKWLLPVVSFGEEIYYRSKKVAGMFVVIWNKAKGGQT